MLVKYPNTIYSFFDWCYSNVIYKKIYEKLGKPRAFDVSLRDGLQGLNIEKQKKFTTFKKIEVYSDIINKHSPKSLECGSFASSKIYPVFNDVIDIHTYIQNDIHSKQFYTNLNNYVFIPNYMHFCQAIKYKNINNFSFISSASNEFLVKNIKTTFDKNYEELSEITRMLDNLFLKNHNYKTKLYISCINECPIVGKLNNDEIISKIIKLNELGFDTICLSDTCGTLEVEDFIYIVDKCNELGIPYRRFSLHLHVKKGRDDFVEEIIYKALDRKIINFDVSYLETGGCSVTISEENLAPNLSYDLYYRALVNYIIEKADKKIQKARK